MTLKAVQRMWVANRKKLESEQKNNAKHCKKRLLNLIKKRSKSQERLVN